MKSSIAFFLTCIFLFVPFSLRAENESAIFAKADSLYESADFKLAALAYERIYFGSDNPDIRAEASLKKANCYKSTGDFEKAYKTLYRNQIAAIQSPDLQFRVLYQTALCAFLNKSYEQAEMALMLSSFVNSELAGNEQVLLLDILIKNELKKWDEAELLSLQYVEKFKNNDPVLVASVQDQYRDRNLPKLKDPRKAVAWSTFLPGSGQIYAGSPGEGIYNVALQVGTLVGATLLIINSYYITGILGGTNFFQSFYFGGLRRAAYLTEHNNAKKVERFNEEVKALLMK